MYEIKCKMCVFTNPEFCNRKLMPLAGLPAQMYGTLCFQPGHALRENKFYICKKGMAVAEVFENDFCIPGDIYFLPFYIE